MQQYLKIDDNYVGVGEIFSGALLLLEIYDMKTFKGINGEFSES